MCAGCERARISGNGSRDGSRDDSRGRLRSKCPPPSGSPGGGQGIISSSLSSLFQKATSDEPGPIMSAVTAGKARVEDAIGLETKAVPDASSLSRLKGVLTGDVAKPQAAKPTKGKKAKQASTKSETAGYSLSELVAPYLPEEVVQIYSNTAGLLTDVDSDQNKRMVRSSLLQAKMLINLSIDVAAKALETPGDRNPLGDVKNIAKDASYFVDILRNSIESTELSDLALAQDPASLSLATKASIAAMNATMHVLKNSPATNN
ncbi:hypothetical protein DSO57_1011299 [Entomophthora muscae]|uniref:Uncharacterized protein n=1 Tax=Entomophthora muscae TaxID=34485 RepID=A0ACC2SJQ1_9FUNG|nr:hypothetical protein DSO57_1011299 [Entomophthora muscae]